MLNTIERVGKLLLSIEEERHSSSIYWLSQVTDFFIFYKIVIFGSDIASWSSLLLETPVDRLCVLNVIFW